jgi:hypothetical protein
VSLLPDDCLLVTRTRGSDYPLRDGDPRSALRTLRDAIEADAKGWSYTLSRLDANGGGKDDRVVLTAVPTLTRRLDVEMCDLPLDLDKQAAAAIALDCLTALAERPVDPAAVEAELLADGLAMLGLEREGADMSTFTLPTPWQGARALVIDDRAGIVADRAALVGPRLEAALPRALSVELRLDMTTALLVVRAVGPTLRRIRQTDPVSRLRALAVAQEFIARID